ncbi:PHP domain-containing protein [Sorangium sp. So ce302]|uniref:PHP domain-containing protein n=1 Tax=Sorangium sp. So ce302 TaxID=3133297 RepID=UPI003F5F39B7
MRKRRSALALPAPRGALGLLALLGLVGLVGCDEPNLLRAKPIENRFELVGGPVAMADVGDFLLENDEIRVAILGPRHSPGPGVYGGSLVDADLRRPDPRFASASGRDRFAESFPVANLLVPDPGATEVFVVDDGSDGQEAIVRVEGDGGFLFHALGVLKTQEDLLGLLFDGLKPAMRFRTDYVLRPGERFVTIRTTLLLPDEVLGCPSVASCALECADGLAAGDDGCPACACGEPLSLDNYAGPSDIFRGILGDERNGDPERKGGIVAGDFVFFGNQNDIFGPGMGFDEEKAVFDALFSGRDTFQQPLSFDFVAAAGGDVSYGYFTKAPEGGPPSTVNVPVFTSAATAFLSAGRSCLAADSDDDACDRKRSFTYERYFAVGEGDIASVAEVVYGARGTPTGALEGAVRWRSTGAPVPNARVHVFRDPDPGAAFASVDALVEANLARSGDVGLLSSVDADLGLDPVEDGDFHARLAPGGYLLVAENPEGTAVSAPIRVALGAGATISVAAELPSPARIAYRVVDEGGRLAPAKLTFVALDAAGQPLEGDGTRRVYLGHGRLGSGVRQIERSATGEGAVEIEPGRYRVLATRGPEFGRFEVPDLEVRAGEVRRIEAVVPREVDSTGWMSIDMHLHQRPSFDSGLPLEERVTSAVVEGLDVAVTTDHDVHTDLAPAVRQLGLEPHLKTAVGAEVSTLELGHFIGFPLRYDELDVPDHGVFDWVCRAGGDVIDGVRGTAAEGDDALVIVAHPRDGFIGYIDQLGVDPFTLRRSIPTLEASNPLFQAGSCDFDAMEVFNGKRLDLLRTPTVQEVVDFNRCLSRIDAATDEASLRAACAELPGGLPACKPGERYAVCQQRARSALAWSVTKRILTRTPEEQDAVWDFDTTAADGEALCLGGEGGAVPPEDADRPCTFHAGQVDDLFRYLDHGFSPTQVGSSDSHGASLEPGFPRTYFRSPTDQPAALDLEEATGALRAGSAFATYGPFIRASVGGATFGGVARVEGDTVPLDLRIETASWFGVDRVEVYVSGRLVRVLEPPSGPSAIVDVDERLVLPAPPSDGWVVVVAMGLRDENLLTPVALPVSFGELQLPRVASLAFTQVEALSRFFTASPPVPDWYPVAPYAVTNPIFLDRDGNGVYDAPRGPPPFCARPCDPAVLDPSQCPEGQQCLVNERVCGIFVLGRCDDKQASP